MELSGVILPDGRIDREGLRFVNGDEQAVDIEFPIVSQSDWIQGRYEAARLEGYGHRQAILVAIHGELLAFVEAPCPVEWGNAVRDMSDDEFYSVPRMRPHEFVPYRDMRCAGQSHAISEMLATRSFPGVRTDAIFNEGRFSSDSGKVGQEQLWLKQQAEAVGVSTNGKWYCRGLASFPGDPTAWVSDRGDVLRVAREKNMNVEGYVEHKAHAVDPGDDVAIADDIIESEVQEILDACPDANPHDVREEVYAVRSGAVDNNPLLVQDNHDFGY